jgi:hypothetical protein
VGGRKYSIAIDESLYYHPPSDTTFVAVAAVLLQNGQVVAKSIVRDKLSGVAKPPHIYQVYKSLYQKSAAELARRVGEDAIEAYYPCRLYATLRRHFGDFLPTDKVRQNGRSRKFELKAHREAHAETVKIRQKIRRWPEIDSYWKSLAKLEVEIYREDLV